MEHFNTIILRIFILACLTFASVSGQESTAKLRAIQSELGIKINVKSYGAKGDARKVSDGVVSSSTTISSASAKFTPDDVGKIIWGVASNILVLPQGTIVSVTDDTTIVVSTAAVGTVSHVNLVIGSDDTTAFHKAAEAADASNPKGNVHIPAGGYVFSDTLFRQNYGHGTDSYGIKGDGSTVTHLFPTPSHALTDGAIFNSATNAQHTIISGLTIDGSMVTYAGSPSVCVGFGGFTFDDVTVTYFLGTFAAFKCPGSQVLIHDSRAVSMGYIGFFIQGGFCELVSCYSGNCYYQAVQIYNAPGTKIDGGVFDECAGETIYSYAAKDTSISAARIYAGSGQTAVYVDGLSSLSLDRCVVEPFGSNGNCTGLKTMAGGLATISCSSLKSSGSGFALNNAGSVTDAGGCLIQSQTGSPVSTRFHGNLFLNLPTSPGASGSLWNDAGSVKIAP